MSFAVEITITDGEHGFRAYRLPETFETVSAADKAAAAHIEELNRAPGDAYWQVFGPDGRDVGPRHFH